LPAAKYTIGQTETLAAEAMIQSRGVVGELTHRIAKIINLIRGGMPRHCKEDNPPLSFFKLGCCFSMKHPT
jgi:hypothetical protein